ncbi:hypothetical protein HMPREF3192_00552 [Atopobium deltae]|uniref:Uncharacterized protein n=1 Tax=Atopobium deltae TaxID=1393034 RepID=A0A133XW64_9ACTN|nr:hypothetical protein HMPREF3192_00552 [Atopobium deltae]
MVANPWRTSYACKTQTQIFSPKMAADLCQQPFFTHVLSYNPRYK